MSNSSEFFSAKAIGLSFLVSILAVFPLFSGTVSAAAINDPQQLIQTVTTQLLQRLNNPAKRSAQPPEYYFKLVEEIVAPSVDFELIAKRVMASSYESATPTQRQNFTQTFRHSLLTTYSKAISTYKDQSVVMLPFLGVQTQGARERATVKMEIHAKGGEVIPVVYALYKNAQGAWKLENITLSGINLGLTFRNQFQAVLKNSKGNMDDAIVAWQKTPG